MELFSLLGKIAVDNSDAKKALSDTSSQASSTATAVARSNKGISGSNKALGSSWGDLKSRVAEYKAQGMSTSDAWKRASADMKSATSDASEGMTGSLKKLGGVIATVFAVDKLVGFGKGCLEAAADMQAMESQFSQVFGKVEQEAGKSLTAIADSTGINENRMKGSFTKIAAFAKTTGMSSAESLGLSERAMIAVADSAAFYDRSLEETTESLQSFLKGNFENDAALGLSCTETTRNAAANKLYGKSFIDLSEDQKQLTLLQMVEDANKASGALGQAARESDTWTNVLGNLRQGWKDFQSVIGDAVLPTAIQTVKRMADGIKNLADNTREAIEWCQEHKTAVEIIGVAIGTVTTAIIAYKVAQNAMAITTALATAATTAFGSVLAFLTSPITLVVAAIGALIAIGVLLYKNWDEIKAKCSELASKIKEKFDAIKNNITNAINGAKEKVTSAFSAIKTKVTSTVDSIKSKVTTVFNNVKNAITNPIKSAKNTVNSVFESIRSSIQKKIESARDKVTNAVNKIKNAFHFSWSLPKLKLPHFKVSGGEAPWGFGGKGSLPKISVSWYKRAMDNAMILNSPTVFGYSAASGNYLGGGEAGSEVISGSATLMRMIKTAVAEQTGGFTEYMQKVVELLAKYMPQLADMEQCIVLDDGTLVGKMAPRMDRELGKIKDRKDRGR